MNRQERFDSLLERIDLPENAGKRNHAIFTETDKIIMDNISKMKCYLEGLHDESRNNLYLAGTYFDRKYKEVVEILDKEGWK